MHKYYLTKRQAGQDRYSKNDVYFEDGYYTEKYREPWVSITKIKQMGVSGLSPAGIFYFVGMENFVDENGADAGTWYIWQQRVMDEWQPLWCLSRTENVQSGDELPETTDINYETGSYVLPSNHTNLTVEGMVEMPARVNYNKYDYILDLNGSCQVEYSGYTDSSIPSGLKPILLRALNGEPFSLLVTNNCDGYTFEFDNFNGYYSDGEWEYYDVRENGGRMSYNEEDNVIVIGGSGN